MTTRRALLTGLVALVAVPAVIRTVFLPPEVRRRAARLLHGYDGHTRFPYPGWRCDMAFLAGPDWSVALADARLA